MKPVNPFKKWSIVWQVMEGDWEDLTINQIAEVLDVHPGTIYGSVRQIRLRTGYCVKHKIGCAGKINNTSGSKL